MNYKSSKYSINWSHHHYHFITFKVMSKRSVLDHNLFTALRQHFLYFHWPDALPDANSWYNADPMLIALVITPGFYLHQVEMADRNQVIGSIYKYKKTI